MKIIHPYGSSRTKPDGSTLRRVLIDNTPRREEHPIPDFAGSHDELVIAQWISAIDKIARKPTGRKKPVPDQYAFRHKLGNACWLRMSNGGRLPGLDAQREHLSAVWWFKIHPYGTETEEPRRRRDGSLPPWAEVKGRWYEVFAGHAAPEALDPQQIAEIVARIETHLYDKEFRLGLDAKPKRKGRIAARAESIAGNVLRKTSDGGDARPAWTTDDIKAYRAPGDPVVAIRKAAEALEANDGRISLPDAAKVLFDHWPKVFRDSDGKALDAPTARTQHAGLLALHDEIKRCYRRLLKRTRRDTREHRKQDPDGRKLSALLPHDLDGALRLSAMQSANSELGDLVRLGKVVHYTVSDGIADSTRAINDPWPDNIETSRFWQSGGQAEIKRAEAFVRIWRQALVLAGLTLRDWLFFEGDILAGDRDTNQRINTALAALQTDEAKQAHFDHKLSLLFGSRAKLVGRDSDRVSLLRGAILGAENLRHAAFHFKGRRELLAELEKLQERRAIKPAAKELWRQDAADRTIRLKAELRGAHVEELLIRAQAAQVFALLRADAVDLPLPQFSRVLRRRDNAWREDTTVRLPEPPNLRKLEESEARLCQYTLLNLVYERPFRAWLSEQKGADISRWIKKATDRATESAKAEADEVGRRVIEARAARLPMPSDEQDIRDFFFELSRETASEMRVQRGYESDAEKAREQAGFIYDLQCDVMILAFGEYLVQHRLDWLRDMRPDQPPSQNPSWSLDDLEDPQPDLKAEDWQAVLYLILHLLPVESVGQLLHQLRRWEIAAGRDAGLSQDERARLEQLFAAMTLYLDMHDAKFEGGDALAGCEPLQELFASKEDGFCKVFRDPSSGAEPDRRVPHRGLREIMRFGHLPVLNAIRGGKTVDDDTIKLVEAMEERQNGSQSKIARLQQRREELHEVWVEAKEPRADTKPFGQEELREYCETLADVAGHREQSNFMHLVDHVRAHRTVMAVLGRLVDYAGLFERDLYFATLGLLYRRTLRPDDLFDASGLDHLRKGRIISALRQHKQDDTARAVISDLTAHFGNVWERGNLRVGIRNALDHLTMLQGATPQLCLTHWVNQARRLMDYDRKLKNAVSKSVIELMAREGIVLRWDMNAAGDSHDLVEGVLSTRCAAHLGERRLKRKGADPKDRKDRGEPIAERLHSHGFVEMLAAAFGGRPQRTASILDDLSQVDWAASAEKKGPRKDRADAGARRPASGREKFRHRRERPQGKD